MDEVVLIAAVTAGLCLAMAGAWAVQRAGGSSGWIDATWTFATGAACAVFALYPIEGGASERDLLVAGLAALWALRLGGHIAARTLKGGDDPRYARLKHEWGAQFQPRLFRFLMLQALAGALLAGSAWLATRNPAPLGLVDVVGAAIFVGALVGEAIADAQLAAFRSDPANAGQVCDRGLWGWSRHPNYFFEWLVWLGFAVMAIDLYSGWPWGWLAFAAPLFMLWLLTKVSGLPPLEAHMARSRGAAWDAYVARTSAFFPLPPKA